MRPPAAFAGQEEGKMAREDLPAFHEQSFRDSLDCWRSPDRRAVLEMSEEEAAYSTLEHAALWLRSRDGDVPDELASLPSPDRVRLVRSACRFASGFALPDHFSRLLQTDALEPEEIEEVEQALSQIDGLDAVVDLSALLVGPDLDQDGGLLHDLSRARCVVADLVSRLSARPDLVAVASRFLLAQRQPRYRDGGRPADWFTRLRELDRGFGDPALAEMLASSPPTPEKPAVVFHTLLGPALSEYDAGAVHLGMAAAGRKDHPTTREQAELSRREFEVEGDEAVLMRLKLRLPPMRPSPTLEVLLEPKEAGGEAAIAAYEAFEVLVTGLPAPLSNRFDFDVGTVELDHQTLNCLRASGHQLAVILITASGQQRPTRPR
jgi:hypothetical protein